MERCSPHGASAWSPAASSSRVRPDGCGRCSWRVRSRSASPTSATRRRRRWPSPALRRCPVESGTASNGRPSSASSQELTPRRLLGRIMGVVEGTASIAPVLGYALGGRDRAGGSSPRAAHRRGLAVALAASFLRIGSVRPARRGAGSARGRNRAGTRSAGDGRAPGGPLSRTSDRPIGTTKPRSGLCLRPPESQGRSTTWRLIAARRLADGGGDLVPRGRLGPARARSPARRARGFRASSSCLVPRAGGERGLRRDHPRIVPAGPRACGRVRARGDDLQLRDAPAGLLDWLTNLSTYAAFPARGRPDAPCADRGRARPRQRARDQERRVRPRGLRRLHGHGHDQLCADRDPQPCLLGAPNPGAVPNSSSSRCFRPSSRRRC